jgi:hypothetical protein
MKLIPRSWTLLKGPPAVQLLKDFPKFYGALRFIFMFTRALHLSLSWARSFQCNTTPDEQNENTLDQVYKNSMVSYGGVTVTRTPMEQDVETLVISQPVSIAPSFHRIASFITVFTRGCHNTLTRRNWIHSTYTRIQLLQVKQIQAISVTGHGGL